MQIRVRSASIAVAFAMATVELLAADCGGGESACTSGDPACGVHPTVTPTVQSVSITGDLGPLRVGQTAQLTATVAVSGGASQAVTWSSSNATVVSVTGGSMLAIAPGTATITATSQANASKSSVLSATVIGVASVSVAPSSAQQLDVGQTSAALTATVTAFGGAATTVAWSSSNTAVATVAATGSTATVKGVSPRTTTITVASTADAAKVATVAITVRAGRSIGDWTPTRLSSLDVSLTASQNGLWGNSNKNVYSVSSDGAIAHYNGSAWQPVVTGKGFFGGIFGNSASDIFAVGLSAAGASSVWHFDGSAWTAQTAPGTARLWSVWSAGSAAVAFAVGEQGTILRYDGTTWSAMTSPTTQTLFGVWGVTATNVYSVGNNGTILHYDGQSWTALAAGQTAHLFSVWASGPTNVIAVGQGGTIVRFDGVSWTPMTSGTTQTLTAIHGSSANQITAVGGAGSLLTFNGTSWTGVTLLVGSLAFNLTSVWDGGPAGAFIGGVVGLTVGFRPGSATLLSYNITYNAVAGGAGAIYATDDLGDVYRFNGTTWTVPANESGLRMYSVSPPFAVGDFGGILQEAADKTWAMVPTPYPLFEGPRLYSVAARSATDAIAVGNGGMILKLTTPGWSVQPSATTAGLRGVWYSADGKTAYAVGQSGTILRYDGTSWAQMTSPVTATLLSVWSPARDTAAPNVVPNVYAAADDGSILVNTAGGATWTVMRSPTSVALTSLWGISATEIYAAGDQGTLLRFDGTSWSSMQSGVTASLTAIGGATGMGAFVLGRAGTALYGAPASSLHSAAATTIRRRVTITREIPSNVIYPDRASSIERGSTVPRTPR